MIDSHSLKLNALKYIFMAAPFYAPSAVFAGTPELSVGGAVTPPSCTASLVGGGALDWQNIMHADLKPNENLRLEPKDITLKVTCSNESKTRFAFWIQDGAQGTAITGSGVSVSDIHNGVAACGSDAPERSFGLGTYQNAENQPVNIGRYVLIGRSGSYDGKESFNKNYAWDYKTATDNVLSGRQVIGSCAYNKNEQWSILQEGNTLASASEFDFTFAVVPELNKSTLIRSDAEVPFSGSATFYVRYF